MILHRPGVSPAPAAFSFPISIIKWSICYIWSVIFLSSMVSFCLNPPTPFGINYSHFICNEWSHRMHSGYWGLKGHKILLLNLYLTWWKLRLHGLCKTFYLTTNRRKYLPQLNAGAFWYCLSKYWPLSFFGSDSWSNIISCREEKQRNMFMPKTFLSQ